jgi:putative flippase GtrA
MAKMQAPTNVLEEISAAPAPSARLRAASLWQIARFGIVGICNTLVDFAALNILLWRFPTHNANLLLLYNALAYSLGALNSFILNKYWTFRTGRGISGREILRFVTVMIGSFLCNESLIWIAGTTLHSLIPNPFLWANLSKASALIGTTSVSYLAMRFWVFATATQKESKARGDPAVFPTTSRITSPIDEDLALKKAEGFRTAHSLSVILPAHNEEANIAKTLYTAIRALSTWVQDFEIIVVNDGSYDRTGLIVEELARVYPRVRLLTHPVNQGYGAALVSGFKSIAKDLVFFMDSDGQFDIRDLERFFPLIERYDAVLGYRMNRQDTLMRKLNAWGWKMLVRAVFGLRARDIDCAFKLYRSEFFRKHDLETRGAMINTEILYKFTRAGYTYTELGIHHLPRRAGRATGAKPSVIARAFQELAIYAWKWRHKKYAA